MTFRPSRLGLADLERELVGSTGMRAAAEAVASAARTAAPDGGPGRGVRETIQAVEDGGHFVAILDPFGHLVEWGSVHNAPYAPLRRGVRAAGLRLSEI